MSPRHFPSGDGPRVDLSDSTADEAPSAADLDFWNDPPVGSSESAVHRPNPPRTS
jgi:hypothetical protein